MIRKTVRGATPGETCRSTAAEIRQIKRREKVNLPKILIERELLCIRVVQRSRAASKGIFRSVRNHLTIRINWLKVPKVQNLTQIQMMSLNIPMQVKPKVVKQSKKLLKRKRDLIKHFHHVRVKGNAVKYFEILYVSSLALHTFIFSYQKIIEQTMFISGFFQSWNTLMLRFDIFLIITLLEQPQMKIYSILAFLALILTFASIEIEPSKQAVVDLQDAPSAIVIDADEQDYNEQKNGQGDPLREQLSSYQGLNKKGSVRRNNRNQNRNQTLEGRRRQRRFNDDYDSEEQSDDSSSESQKNTL